ncbi:MAG TPA: LuxR family transcriptional regulator [Sphingomonas sp.]|nr:LuxR family transcriptional regulator [Sphingomonas sp.]
MFDKVSRDRVGKNDLSVAGEFLEIARAATSNDALRLLMDAAARALGFHYYALIHHADLRQPSRGLICLENYPPVWSEHYIRNRIYLSDPIIHASLRTNSGFAWSNVPRMIRLTHLQERILECAAKEGLGCGFTVPACVPGERTGSCSFVTRYGRALPRYALMVAQLVGAFAFQAARRIAGLDGAPDLTVPRLSPRQRECVLLVGQGKSDWEIGGILGLSEDTVTKYLNAARRRYGVVRRVQLVIAAIYDGQIALHEIVNWQ